MTFDQADVAGRLINWRDRCEQNIVDWPKGKFFEVDWPDGKSFKMHFVEHLAEADRSYHLDDIRSIVDDFVGARRNLADWYGAILDIFENTLIFQNNAPRLRAGALTRWRKITGFLDPDALVALRIARDLSARDDAGEVVSSLSDWGYFVTMSDHGLDRVLNRGLSDIHVHFEASDPMSLLWLRLATGRVQAKDLQYFSDKVMRDMGTGSLDRARRERDRERLEQAERLRRELIERIAPRRSDARPDSHHGELAGERTLLVAAWWAALNAPSLDLSNTLDKYLFAKNLFVRRHQQRADQGPGLTRFREFLDRGEPISERRAKRVRPCVRRERMSRMLSLATEAPMLRHLELRIAPQNTLREWHDFFRLWTRFFGQLGAERSLSIRFTVHFIRKPDTSGTNACDMHFGKLRQTLDRQSATLQLFRRRCPDLARHITGVDVANMERGAPPEIFVPYLCLLRGDSKQAGHLDHDALRRWKRLEELKLHRPPPQLPRLGVTYHAGEDFHHPLDGMRAIAGLLETVLQPGDRIGHGLAPGLDVARFGKERAPGPIPNGVVLDDLVWLRKEAVRLGCWTGGCQAAGDKTISRLAFEIYRHDWQVATLERALLERFRMPRRAGVSSLPEVELVWKETYNKDVRERRAAFANTETREALRVDDNVIRAVQDNLIRSIRQSGVIVEANPSSNLITGVVGDLCDHPFFRYLSVLGDQGIVTINTDDPGVFGTRIDIEFGMMFEAMLRGGIDRNRALHILEGARQLAEDFAFDGMMR